MAQLAIQPSINDLRSQSLRVLIERLGALDLTPLLVYRFDSAPDSALLPLAWQFDMLAPQWQLGAQIAESIDALQNIDTLSDIDSLSSPADVSGWSDYDSLRALLEVAIPLHRTRGTPYAIKSALASLGWPSATIQEGQASWGGGEYPESQGWAVFRVTLNLNPNQTVGNQDATRASAAIKFFKPVRAKLDSIWFGAPPLIDTATAPTDFVVSIFSRTDPAPTVIDVITAPAWALADRRAIMPDYDSRFTYHGITYGADEPVVADSGVVVNSVAVGETEN